MAKPDVSYNSLINEGNPFTERDEHEPDPNFDDAFDADNEDTPRNSGIIIQVVPETDKGKILVLLLISLYYFNNFICFFFLVKILQQDGIISKI